MDARRKASRNYASIDYRWVPLDLTSPTLSDNRQEDVSQTTNPHKQSYKQSEPKAPELLTTSQLASVVGRVWNSAFCPVPDFQPKANVGQSDIFCQKEDALCYSSAERDKKLSATNTEYFFVHLKSSKVNGTSECTDAAQKNSMFDSPNRLSSHSLIWRYLQLGDSYRPMESWKVSGLMTVGISYDFAEAYERIIRNSFRGLTCDSNKLDETCISGRNATGLAPGSTSSLSTVTKCKDPPRDNIAGVAKNEDKPVTSLYSDCFQRPVTNLRTIDAVSKNSDSIPRAEYHIDHVDVRSCACKELPKTPEEDTKFENKRRQPKELLPVKTTGIELCTAVRDKPNHALSGRRHAFAGAMSGTFVSLCLHPVDTIKTVIQSRCMDEKSLSHVIRSIISERGVSGLYRGFASNIASSAPISAVYTYTYESVKQVLLPILPKEYHSVAHCTAGGCASIATSFIFTPSERIKQQMQVGSLYQNCWNALVGILAKGGLPSLYTGWSAVLCRNIPHSIIKFYTYETLKQRVMSLTPSNARPSIFLTLICGGVAGSTAALFTTPFDVVKTRLQTQIPGSSCRYDGVFHALIEISKHEGLRGLYRGLTPRLVMYVSQGALFFASYEIFKTIFFLELPQLYAPAIQNKENAVEESSAMKASASTPSLPKLPSFHS